MRQRWTGLALLATLLLVAASVIAAKPAHAAANSQANGRGSTTAFVCPSGTTSPATIDFNASKQKGIVSGFGNIRGADVSKLFSLGAGTLNKNSYSLKGSTSTAFGPTACEGAFSELPEEVSLSGQCGTGVVIHYTDSGGQRGDFVGNVICT